ncbi:signal peptidase II [Anaerosphaera multitolerans]|uniref:Lipoprotein signal peptidase n=1 Tax=Anaerosphaera multitolerans TaxID=2487351 RepID=A0A437S8J8_9FIRM|nr:signal peptidase II [Anaerosphaera multitolerans]RVU55168.1 signal peptidase II [Anaerosphaera multitolerans]
MGVFFFSILLVLIDQLSKFFVVRFLKGNAPVVVIEDVLNFYYLENRGAAFGIMQNKRIVFIAITVIVIAVLVSLLYKNYENSSLMLKASISLIIGGTLGNFIDRIRLHYVVDFISINIKKINFQFAVFNLADVFIVVGTILLILIVLLHDNPKRIKNAN